MIIWHLPGLLAKVGCLLFLFGSAAAMDNCCFVFLFFCFCFLGTQIDHKGRLIVVFVFAVLPKWLIVIFLLFFCRVAGCNWEGGIHPDVWYPDSHKRD